MNTIQARPSASVTGRILDWIAHFERAMEMRPVDYLELRVADLERRVDGLLADGSARAHANTKAEV